MYVYVAAAITTRLFSVRRIKNFDLKIRENNYHWRCVFQNIHAFINIL